MRLLERARGDVDAAHALEAALEAEVSLPERAEQDGERLLQTRAALAVRNAEGLEVALAPADADAEQRAAAREQVERGQLLGNVDGVVERQQQRLRREADALGLPRDRREREEGRGARCLQA